MKLIRLGRKDKFAIVDDEDFERVSLYRWHFHEYRVISADLNERKFYAGRVTKQYYWMPLARFILGTDKYQRIRHANTNRLDFRRKNLIVTVQVLRQRTSEYAVLKTHGPTGYRKRLQPVATEESCPPSTR